MQLAWLCLNDSERRGVQKGKDEENNSCGALNSASKGL